MTLVSVIVISINQAFAWRLVEAQLMLMLMALTTLKFPSLAKRHSSSAHMCTTQFNFSLGPGVLKHAEATNFFSSFILAIVGEGSI
jgi:hypothetical protein